MRPPRAADDPYSFWGADVLHDFLARHQGPAHTEVRDLVVRWLFYVLMHDPRAIESTSVPGEELAVFAWVPETDVAVSWEVLEAIHTVAVFEIRGLYEI